MGADFWTSAAAWPYLQHRHRLRTRHLHVQGDPEAKGRRGSRVALDFQRQLRPQLDLGGRRVLRGPVALDLHFTVGRKNPPAIHNIAKCALDVLGPEAAGLGRPRRHLLYLDDRQVKLLHVHLHQSWEGNNTPHVPGQTYVVAQPIRDVVEQLQLAYRIRHEDHEALDLDEYEVTEIWQSIYDDEHEDVDDWDEPATGTWPGDPEFGKRLELWNEFHRRERVQRSLLKTTDTLIANALHAAPLWIAGARRPADKYPESEVWQQLQQAVRETEGGRWRLIMSEPIAVPLPELPKSDGTYDQFRQAVRDQLQGFRRRWPVFDPLLVPLKLTLLVVPPKQGKDLDNIALDVLPIAHEVLKPHISPWLLAPRLQDTPHHDEGLRRLIRQFWFAV